MHCNNLTKVQEELIGLLQEEAAEVIQELSKIRRTGTDFCRKGGNVPNIIFFQKELIDFMLLVDLADKAELLLHDFDCDEYAVQKLERLKEWTNLPHDLIESI